MTKKTQLRINLLRYSQSADINDANLSQVVVKAATPSQEKTILWTMPKIMKTPSSQPPNRMNGNMGKLAVKNRP